MEKLVLPDELVAIVDSEKIYFSVLSKKNHSRKKSLGIIFFGVAWTLFTSIFVVVFIGPYFNGGVVPFAKNKIPNGGDSNNFLGLLPLCLGLGLFLIVGIGALCRGFYRLFQKGGYFVATNTRLIKYLNGNTNTYYWSQFSGNLEVNNAKGEILLELKTGRTISENSEDRFVPDTLFISGVSDAITIAKICRKRMEGHHSLTTETDRNEP